MSENNFSIFKTPEAFIGMRDAGRLAAETLDYITGFVEPGVTTGYLNDLIAAFIKEHKAIAAPLNYKGFPKETCISPNHVICHGIPGSKKLKSGDVINIDVTVILDGWYGDSSRMYYVGNKINARTKKLIDVTYECLMRAIDIVKPGVRLGDIGHIIQTHAEGNGFSIVRDFCGHGLGREFHTLPAILHYGNKGEGTPLEEGTMFTIEPMINAGRPEMRMLADDWTAVTRDKSISAQFEHSLGITKDGVEIFTLSPKGLNRPPYMLS